MFKFSFQSFKLKVQNFKLNFLSFILLNSIYFARIEVIIIEKSMKNNKYKPTNDYMFSRVFGDNDSREILKSFLQSILTDIEIVKIESVKQAHLDANSINKKFSRMDILATINNNLKINIEMQMVDLHNTVDRSLYYVERLATKDLEKNQRYTNLPKTICIWILNYDIFESDAPFHDISRLRRDYNSEVLTDKLEMHYIQLPKFKKKCKHISTALEQWLTFIINDDLEEVKNMDNKLIHDAQSKLDLLNDSEEAREIAERIADAERNERDALDYERKAGIAEGISQKNLEIIKNMLAKNTDIEFISEVTNTSKEEIIKIKNNLK